VNTNTDNLDFRKNSDLIDCVTYLGDQASGRGSNLQISEYFFDDEIEIELINEHGLESIREVGE
jgi:hypothetical protein